MIRKLTAVLIAVLVVSAGAAAVGASPPDNAPAPADNANDEEREESDDEERRGPPAHADNKSPKADNSGNGLALGALVSEQASESETKGDITTFIFGLFPETHPAAVNNNAGSDMNETGEEVNASTVESQIESVREAVASNNVSEEERREITENVKLAERLYEQSQASSGDKKAELLEEAMDSLDEASELINGDE
jgi:hypothetical protein